MSSIAISFRSFLTSAITIAAREECGRRFCYLRMINSGARGKRANPGNSLETSRYITPGVLSVKGFFDPHQGRQDGHCIWTVMSDLSHGVVIRICATRDNTSPPSLEREGVRGWLSPFLHFRVRHPLAYVLLS